MIPLDPVDTGANSLEATRQALKGTWTLASLEVVDERGARRAVKAAGQLTYDAYGNMTIRGLVDDPAAKGAVILNYQGRIVIDTVRHQFFPADLVSNKSTDGSQMAPVSPDKVRQYQLSGKYFVVTYLDASGRATAVAQWRRP